MGDLQLGFPKVLRLVASPEGSVPSASIHSPCGGSPVSPHPGQEGALGQGLLLLLMPGMAPKTALS